MLLIWSSKKFMLEKAYVWRVLLKEFLGVDYQLTYDDSVADYKIQLENNALLVFRDDLELAKRHFYAKNKMPRFKHC